MKSKKRISEAVMHATLLLIIGKRLEVHGKAGLVIYLGSSKQDRPDPYWYEHPGGRTYKREAKEVVKAVLPHVGSEALLKAKSYSQ